MPFRDVFIGEMRVSRAQAIALAEQHVRVCYRADSVELHPRAVAAYRAPAGWTVVFRRRQRRSAWGRAVTMDWFGQKIRVGSRDLDLTLPALGN